MKTFTATPDDISHDWHVVDAAGVPLGRLARGPSGCSVAFTNHQRRAMSCGFTV